MEKDPTIVGNGWHSPRLNGNQLKNNTFVIINFISLEDREVSLLKKKEKKI